ncbi:DNA-directed RNA polymerase [Candidatus Micrarchaeota archaeon]|nr:DNA-directed RNA polymerase [Candidatus Micrarchaeota archaeon]
MFNLLHVKDKVRVPPRYFSMRLEDALTELLSEKYERVVDKEIGVVLSIHNVEPKSEGIIIPGDPSAYFDVEFDALVFKPVVNEVVRTEVTEVVEFGAFLWLGPVDGLVHLSQITNDFLTYNRRIPALIGKDTKRTLKKGDTVLAKISTVSMSGTIKDVKIGLTMRPLGLGKEEWVVQELKKREKEKTAEKQKKKKK